jgi:hypothetical protein
MGPQLCRPEIVTMSKPSDQKWTSAYTRASVEAYLDAADAECVRIETAIAAARARTERARVGGQQLDALGVQPAWNGPGAGLDGPAMPDRLDPAIVDQTLWLQPDTAAASGD